jgi:hypothetical protein
MNVALPFVYQHLAQASACANIVFLFLLSLILIALAYLSIAGPSLAKTQNLCYHA